MKHMWTEGLDSRFIEILTKKMVERGWNYQKFIDQEGILREGWGMPGGDCDFEEWDRVSREIGKEIKAQFPEFVSIEI